jgi:hypothetical protein
MFFRLLTLLLVIASSSPVSARPDRRLVANIRHDLQPSRLKQIVLYSGAGAETAFGAGKHRKLKCPSTPEDLVRSVGSRLMSKSPLVTGLTSCPYTAGCFALGVRDREPSSVQAFGASKGYIGVTKGRLLPTARFTALLARYKTALPTLLAVMGKNRIVVDAQQLTSHLADRYPGILTPGFQRMIGASLEREAEYLVFGQTPRFDRVVKIARDDVVPATPGAFFNPGLLQRLKEYPLPAQR